VLGRSAPAEQTVASVVVLYARPGASRLCLLGPGGTPAADLTLLFGSTGHRPPSSDILQATAVRGRSMCRVESASSLL